MDGWQAITYANSSMGPIISKWVKAMFTNDVIITIQMSWLAVILELGMGNVAVVLVTGGSSPRATCQTLILEVVVMMTGADCSSTCRTPQKLVPWNVAQGSKSYSLDVVKSGAFLPSTMPCKCTQIWFACDFTDNCSQEPYHQDESLKWYFICILRSIYIIWIWSLASCYLAGLLLPTWLMRLGQANI